MKNNLNVAIIIFEPQDGILNTMNHCSESACFGLIDVVFFVVIIPIVHRASSSAYNIIFDKYMVNNNIIR